MCGIVGYTGNRNAVDVVFDGLKTLEYRGYDSAGIAIQNGKIEVFKTIGRVAQLLPLLPNCLSHTAIGHTRWATHGKPLAKNAHPHLSNDGRWAIVVTRQVEGTSFYELCRRPDGISPAQAETFAADVLRMAAVLRKTGIVHRDINQKNLLLDQDGHLKLIDFQFAIDRNRYQETAFMRRDWKYLYVVFGLNRELGVGQWNDTPLLIYVLRQLPQTDAVARAIRELEGVSEAGLFVAPVPSMIFFRLRLHIWSLRFRLLFHPRGTRAERLRYRLETVREALNFHRREGQNSS